MSAANQPSFLVVFCFSIGPFFARFRSSILQQQLLFLLCGSPSARIEVKRNNFRCCVTCVERRSKEGQETLDGNILLLSARDVKLRVTCSMRLTRSLSVCHDLPFSFFLFFLDSGETLDPVASLTPPSQKMFFGCWVKMIVDNNVQDTRFVYRTDAKKSKHKQNKIEKKPRR